MSIESETEKIPLFSFVYADVQKITDSLPNVASDRILESMKTVEIDPEEGTSYESKGASEIEREHFSEKLADPGDARIRGVVETTRSINEAEGGGEADGGLGSDVE